MATEIGKLVATFEGNVGPIMQSFKQVQAGSKQTAQIIVDSQKQMSQAEMRAAQESKLAAYLHRQQLNLLVTQYKQTQKAAEQAAAGVKPFRQVLGDLSGSLDGLTKSIITMQGPLGGIASRISSFSGLTAEAAAGTGGLAIALGVVAAATVGAGYGFYALATSVAEGTGKFKDLSQQTGFSVETLSALNNAAETTGGSIDSITSALFMFETKMGEAKDKTSEMARIFKTFGIDTRDNEKALRQAIDALLAMKNADDQATLGKKLFGRSVRDLLGAIKEAGSLDAFLNDQLKKGTLITTEAANKGDELSDAIKIMGRTFDMVRRIVGESFGPTVLKVVNEITKALEDNKSVIEKWGESASIAFAQASAGAGWLLTKIGELVKGIENLSGMPIPSILNYLAAYGTLPGAIFTGLRIAGGAKTVGEIVSPGSTGPSAQTQADLLKMQQAFPARQPGYRFGGKWSSYVPPVSWEDTIKTTGGGRGGRSGGGSAREEAGVKFLEQLEKQFKNLIGKTELERVQEQLLEKQYRNTSDAVRKRILITAMEIDQRKKILALTRERLATGIEEREEFEKFTKLVQESLTRRRTMADITGLDFVNLGGGSVYGAGESSTRPRRVTDLTRPRIATEREQALRQQYQEHLQRIQQLAYETTSILDRAIYDGISGGLKKGLQSLGLSILDFLKNIFLRRLEAAIAKAFEGASAGAGGGSFWGKLLGWLIGGVAGGFGGSIGGIGGGKSGTFSGSGAGTLGKGFASGGLMTPNSWNMVGERGPELVYTGNNYHQVYNQSQMKQLGGNTVINISVPESRIADSYKSPRSRRQLAQDIASAIQGGLS